MSTDQDQQTALRDPTLEVSLHLSGYHWEARLDNENPGWCHHEHLDRRRLHLCPRQHQGAKRPLESRLQAAGCRLKAQLPGAVAPVHFAAETGRAPFFFTGATGPPTASLGARQFP